MSGDGKVLTVERVAEFRADHPDYLPVEDICDSHEALRADRAILRSDQAQMRAQFDRLVYERDTMLAERDALAARVRVLRSLLRGLVDGVDQWNEAVERIIGRQVGYKWPELDRAKDELAGATKEGA